MWKKPHIYIYVGILWDNKCSIASIPWKCIGIWQEWRWLLGQTCNDRRLDWGEGDWRDMEIENGDVCAAPGRALESGDFASFFGFTARGPRDYDRAPRECRQPTPRQLAVRGKQFDEFSNTSTQGILIESLNYYRAFQGTRDEPFDAYLYRVGT